MTTVLTSLIEPLTTAPSRDRTMERLPGRSYVFLSGLGNNVPLREQIRRAGYTDAVHAQGWDLLKVVQSITAGGTNMTGNPVTDAVTTLKMWAGPGFRRIQAALLHLHPEQAAFVFDGIDPDNKVPVMDIDVMLDRLDTLEGTGKDEDKKAIATLADRGFDAAERKRLRDLVKIAESAPKGTVSPSPDSREAALAALKSWYDDWTDTARTVFGKRSDLIKLGLAKRNTRNAVAGKDNAPAPPATPSGTPATPSATPVTPHVASATPA
jgi:hypothetical protein